MPVTAFGDSFLLAGPAFWAPATAVTPVLVTALAFWLAVAPAVLTSFLVALIPLLKFFNDSQLVSWQE